MRMVIIEPNAVLKEGLERILTNRGHSVLQSVENVDALRALTEPSDDMAVVLRVSGDSSLIDTVPRVRQVLGDVICIVLSAKFDSGTTIAAIKAGAHALLDESTSSDAFLKTIDLVGSGYAVISLDNLTGQNFTNAPARCPESITAGNDAKNEANRPDNNGAGRMPSLSPREMAILEMLQEGEPNKVIARRLCLTESTVKVHLKAILRKIRVKNRTQAAIWALQQENLLETSRTHSQSPSG